jgi:DNA helicase-2/ATP-dependent DNA helicase PcrA
LIERGVPVSKLLVCTFINKAANDIRERLRKTTTVSPYDLWLGTFHTLGFRILCRHAERLDISDEFIIRETRNIFRDMRLSVGKYRINAVIRFVETLKAKGITPNKFEPQTAWEKSCHDAYKKYQEYKQQKNVMDYDDLILHAIDLLENNQDVREQYQNLFDYIFVDELQDINPAQYKLINLIYKGRIFFTGDEDQAIYGWRGAEREIMHRVPKDYRNIKIFQLNKSFRLAQGIIDIASNLMHREALMIPGPQTGDVFVYAAKSEQDEADYIVREIKRLRKEDFDFRDITILSRMHYLTRFYEETFAKSRIPYALIGGQSFYERAEVKPIIEYLQLLEAAIAEKGELPTFLAKANNLFKIKKKKQKRAAEIYEHHWSNIKLLRPHKLIEDITDLIGIKGETLTELRSMAVSHKNEDLTGFLNELQLVQDLDLVDWTKDVVKVMTVHSAKGLEFPVVFIVDLVEDIFPMTKKISSPKEVEEERRLCYVALTRAQRKLYLLYPKWRHGRYQHPSRFLIDMLKIDS